MSDSTLQVLLDAMALLQELPDDKHWLFGKGRTKVGEPLYGCQIFNSYEDGTTKERPFAEAENDDPRECVRTALNRARGRQ